MVVGSAGVRGVLADGTFTLISLRIFICFSLFLSFFAYTQFLYYCADVRKSRVPKIYISAEINPKLYTQDQHQLSDKFRNPDDSMARRTSRIKKRLDDSTACRAATLFAAM